MCFTFVQEKRRLLRKKELNWHSPPRKIWVLRGFCYRSNLLNLFLGVDE